MPETAPREIHALYSVQNGLHVFVSNELPGMMHAHRDLKSAFEGLSQTVNALVSIKFGVNESYSASVSYEEFKRSIDAPDHFPIMPVLLSTNPARDQRA